MIIRYTKRWPKTAENAGSCSTSNGWLTGLMLTAHGSVVAVGPAGLSDCSLLSNTFMNVAFDRRMDPEVPGVCSSAGERRWACPPPWEILWSEVESTATRPSAAPSYSRRLVSTDTWFDGRGAVQASGLSLPRAWTWLPAVCGREVRLFAHFAVASVTRHRPVGAV
jgi:hypothetical protein